MVPDQIRWLDRLRTARSPPQLAARVGDGLLAPEYDFLEWHREGLALLTNLSVRELPRRVGVERLRNLPLFIPSRGVIADFVERWYVPDFRTHLQVVAEIDDIYYGLALLPPS
ncbi:hypothetical protein ACFYRL_30165 [Streptomyces goshikiensis]|uniref:hypothetical protein n=1 Tax=Streptomyces goshikiensis TaxID=1942 RepID=UPI0036B74253